MILPNLYSPSLYSSSIYVPCLIVSSILMYNLYLYIKRVQPETFIDTEKADASASASTVSAVNTNTSAVNTMQKSNLIFLGDSILKNNAYVKPNYSVEYLLKQQYKKPIFFLAKDGADIKAVYKQLAKIPDRLNTADCAIFLSIGGNDLLQQNSKVDVLFQQYEKFLKVLKLKFGKCKIILLNLYNPPSMAKKLILRNKIQQWNTQLKDYAIKTALALIPLDTLLTEPTDFVDNYEPSEIGSQKIVKQII